MRDDDIFSDQLIEIADIVAGEFAVVGDYLEGELDSGFAGMALAEATVFVGGEMFVKFEEHFLDLFVDGGQVGGRAEFVEEDGVAFDLGDFEADLIGIDEGLQEFLDDQAAVVDFRFVDEFRKAADIGNKE